MRGHQITPPPFLHCLEKKKSNYKVDYATHSLVMYVYTDSRYHNFKVQIVYDLLAFIFNTNIEPPIEIILSTAFIKVLPQESQEEVCLRLLMLLDAERKKSELDKMFLRVIFPPTSKFYSYRPVQRSREVSWLLNLVSEINP